MRQFKTEVLDVLIEKLKPLWSLTFGDYQILPRLNTKLGITWS
jgi:hypothetical protein